MSFIPKNLKLNNKLDIKKLFSNSYIDANCNALKDDLYNNIILNSSFNYINKNMFESYYFPSYLYLKSTKALYNKKPLLIGMSAPQVRTLLLL